MRNAANQYLEFSLKFFIQLISFEMFQLLRSSVGELNENEKKFTGSSEICD